MKIIWNYYNYLIQKWNNKKENKFIPCGLSSFVLYLTSLFWIAFWSPLYWSIGFVGVAMAMKKSTLIKKSSCWRFPWEQQREKLIIESKKETFLFESSFNTRFIWKTIWNIFENPSFQIFNNSWQRICYCYINICLWKSFINIYIPLFLSLFVCSSGHAPRRKTSYF